MQACTRAMKFDCVAMNLPCDAMKHHCEAMQLHHDAMQLLHAAMKLHWNAIMLHRDATNPSCDAIGLPKSAIGVRDYPMPPGCVSVCDRRIDSNVPTTGLRPAGKRAPRHREVRSMPGNSMRPCCLTMRDSCAPMQSRHPASCTVRLQYGRRRPEPPPSAGFSRSPG